MDEASFRLPNYRGSHQRRYHPYARVARRSPRGLLSDANTDSGQITAVEVNAGAQGADAVPEGDCAVLERAMFDEEEEVEVATRRGAFFALIIILAYAVQWYYNKVRDEVNTAA